MGDGRWELGVGSWERGTGDGETGWWLNLRRLVLTGLICYLKNNGIPARMHILEIVCLTPYSLLRSVSDSRTVLLTPYSGQ
jgi:hypothetical protein